ncbi:MAG: hypothetical protein AVDCRST_MAG72-2401, partial [uncultured Nocardioidaceae bacterium]
AANLELRLVEAGRRRDRLRRALRGRPARARLRVHRRCRTRGRPGRRRLRAARQPRPGHPVAAAADQPLAGRDDPGRLADDPHHAPDAAAVADVGGAEDALAVLLRLRRTVSGRAGGPDRGQSVPARQSGHRCRWAQRVHPHHGDPRGDRAAHHTVAGGGGGVRVPRLPDADHRLLLVLLVGTDLACPMGRDPHHSDGLRARARRAELPLVLRPVHVRPDRRLAGDPHRRARGGHRYAHLEQLPGVRLRAVLRRPRREPEHLRGRLVQHHRDADPGRCVRRTRACRGKGDEHPAAHEPAEATTRRVRHSPATGAVGCL